MENIIDKLNQIKRNKETESIFDNWSSEEIKQLLNLYLIISKKEHHIFDLIITIVIVGKIFFATMISIIYKINQEVFKLR